MPSFAILELKPNNYSQSNMNIADLKKQKWLLPRGQELSGESRTRIRMGYHNWRCQSSQKATGKSDPDENSTLALDPWDIHFSVNFQHSLSPKSWSMFLQSASSWGASMSGKPVYFIPSRWFYPEEHLLAELLGYHQSYLSGSASPMSPSGGAENMDPWI